jgi:glutamine synthetase
MTPQEVLKLCREKDIESVDIRFTDLLGSWQHFTIPVSKLTDEVFENGLGFDGSSIRGWQPIDHSDMLVVPQPETAFRDTFTELSSLAVIGNIRDPATGEEYTRDPRNIARKAANYLNSTGIADTACFGPELQFYILDDVRFDQNPREAYYHVDSSEGIWNRGRDESPNLGYKPRHQGGYFPVPPTDQTMDLRNEMLQRLIDSGLDVEGHHHELGTAGQAGIDLRFDSLVRAADAVMRYKYIVRNVARRQEKTVTFMPQPIFGDNGNAMHTHFSLWKDEQPLFAGHDYAGLSELAIHAIGGILRHAPALLAFTNPTTNSYKRLVPGGDAPVHLAYSQRNRSVACRIPLVGTNPRAKRVEFRCPDPTCNPYLALSALLMAALDGIQNKIHPGEPLNRNAYTLSPQQVAEAEIQMTPTSLAEALSALEQDHDFLLRGGVFTADVVDTWVSYKRTQEVEALRRRPHPFEFCLYFDA